MPCIGLATAPEPAAPPAAVRSRRRRPSDAHGGSVVCSRTSKERPSTSTATTRSRVCAPSAPSSYACCPMRERLGHLLRALRQLLRLHEPVAGAAFDEARLREQRRVEAEERRRALDPELGERAQHPPPGRLAIRVVDDQLGDHRVVEPRDLVSRPHAGVDPHARARRLLVRRDQARAPAGSPCSTSSALMRHSIACPRSVTSSCRSGERLALRDRGSAPARGRGP